jgi:small subunit ribosomal protein S8
MVTDPIADFLTRIRNAQMAGHTIVDIPASNMKKKLTQILFDNGYILQYRFDEEGPQGTIKIALKYNQETRIPAIRELVRISKPGLRKYTHVEGIPRVKNGLGIAIMSTSKGIITDKEARSLKVGGEIICIVS